MTFCWAPGVRLIEQKIGLAVFLKTYFPSFVSEQRQRYFKEYIIDRAK